MEKIKALIIQLADSLQKQKKVVLALSCFVVFITTYMLILPAFTLEKDKAAEQGGIDVPGTVTTVEETTTQAEETPVVTEDAVDAGADTAEQAGAAESDSKTAKNESTVLADEAMTEDAAQEENADSEPIIFEGDGYTVTVEDPAGVLPEDTTVEVEELLENLEADTKEEREAKEEEYRNYYDKALKAVNENTSDDETKSISFAKFYNITLVSGGKEIQPDKPVNVTITYDKNQ